MGRGFIVSYVGIKLQENGAPQSLVNPEQWIDTIAGKSIIYVGGLFKQFICVLSIIVLVPTQSQILT